MKAVKFMCASIVVFGVAAAGSTAPVGAKTFSIVVHRVAQIDNLDKLDQLGSDKADFFMMLWVNGKDMGRTENVSTDDGPTTWRRNLSSSARYVKIRMRLMDDDGGLEKGDDHVDINPRSGKKDIDFTYDTRTGRITGDVTGRRGTTIHAKGSNDTDHGQMWFSIQ